MYYTVMSPKLFEWEPPVHLAECLTGRDRNPAETDLGARANALACGTEVQRAAELREWPNAGTQTSLAVGSSCLLGLSFPLCSRAGSADLMSPGSSRLTSHPLETSVNEEPNPAPGSHCDDLFMFLALLPKLWTVGYNTLWLYGRGVEKT